MIALILARPTLVTGFGTCAISIAKNVANFANDGAAKFMFPQHLRELTELSIVVLGIVNESVGIDDNHQLQQFYLALLQDGGMLVIVYHQVY